VVQKGDTLSSIGRKFGVTADAIAKANKITNPNKITVGEKLIIPPK
jgi:LysM repeat protein